MPDFRLTSEQVQGVRIPLRTLNVRVPRSSEKVRLDVNDSEGDLDIARLPGQPFDQLYLSKDQVDGVTISAHPLQDATFGAACKVPLEIEVVQQGDGEQFRVQIDPVDVGGLSGASLVELQVEGEWVRVSPVVTDSVELVGLASRAQVAAAQQLGLTSKVRRAAGQDLAVTVDGSASLVPWTQDQSVASVIDVIAGVDRALGRDGQLDVVVASDEGRWLQLAAHGAGAAVASLVADGAPRTGADLWAQPAPAGSAWVVLTDHVPGVIPDAVAALLMLATSAAGVLLPVDVDPRVVLVPRRSGRGVGDRLEDPADPLLSDVVARLLLACGARTNEGEEL